MYYEFAPIAASEALVERFYSIAGFVWDNRGYNLNSRNVTVMCDHETFIVENISGI